ncbi:MAG TPA: MotA/TolQ/ExbB proton channel family protein [Prolixibacteraceae bacterium]|nr:MotA/TolQ/ExbB proton channel family protein [Prolixibacteraceae bacterium]
MKLFQLFYEGGPVFMLVITFFGLLMLASSGYKIFRMILKKEFDLLQMNYILLFGSLSLIFGILGQGMGLFGAMEAISVAGDISPSLVAAGFRVSMITPLYGIFIFIFSLIFWGVLKEINLRKMIH